MGRPVARRRRGTVGTGFGVGGQGKVGDGLWSFGDVEGDAGVVVGYVLYQVDVRVVALAPAVARVHRGDVMSAVQGRALVGDEAAEYVIMGEGSNLSRRRGTGAGWCPRSRPPVRHCLCPARGSRYPNARCHTRWKEVSGHNNPSRQSQCCLGPARGSRAPNARCDTR